MCMSLSRRLLLPCALVGAIKKVAPFIQICTAGFRAYIEEMNVCTEFTFSSDGIGFVCALRFSHLVSARI